MTRNQTDDAQHGTLTRTAARVRLARAPGILFLTAGLILPLSGVMALDVPDAPPLPAEPSLAAPAPVEAAPATAPAHAAPAAEDAPLFASGDRLDADEQAAFLEWVAAQQAAGKHRGVAVYSSW